jgi:hypothetical protein
LARLRSTTELYPLFSPSRYIVGKKNPTVN